MKKIKILFLVLLLLGLTLVLVVRRLPRRANSTVLQSMPTPTPFSQEEKEAWWKQASTDPYVHHIRKALNGYLNGTNEGIRDPDLVIPARTDENGVGSGLAAFNKDYYRSKFIVLSIVNGYFGGKEMNIVFQNKPDKVFWAWVYKPIEEDYILKGFAENTKLIKPEQMEDFVKYNKAALEDKEHAL